MINSVCALGEYLNPFDYFIWFTFAALGMWKIVDFSKSLEKYLERKINGRDS